MRRVGAFFLNIVMIGVLGTTPSSADPEPSNSLLPVFLADVESQFDALALRPDGLAFGIGTSPDPRICKHYQGMARVNGLDGTPYMILSRSGNQPGGVGSISCPLEGDDPGNLLTVRMGSRDTNGERLRSNRFVRDWPINGDINVPIGPTPPDYRDHVVTTISFDGTDWDNYAHPGGMQVIEDVLVLAMEEPYDEDLPKNLFMFFDISNPEDPVLLSQWEPLDAGDFFSAGLVGITPISAPSGDCCQYVIIAAGKENKNVRFYRSLPTDEVTGTTDLRLPAPALAWEETGRFTEGQIEDCLNIDNPYYPLLAIDWHTGGGDAHQMLNFVRQGGVDGPLYLVGARNTTPLPSGDDKLDLYRISLQDSGAPEDCFIELINTTHVTSKPFMGGGDSANFAAAAATYLSSSGELIVYAAEFENDGPHEIRADGSRGRRTVRFGEYRHENMVRSDSPTLKPAVDVAAQWDVDEGSTFMLDADAQQAITKSWIELYEDDGSGASLPGFGDSDLWLAVDYPDRDADDFDHFGKLHFNNNAGSWRWFAHDGCTIAANDFTIANSDPPGPDTVFLMGDGTVQIETNLDDIGYDDDVGGITFDADCSAYYGASIGVSWDLDGNGSFEASGLSVLFDAGLLDGPYVQMIAARAEHPTDGSSLGRSAPVQAQVTVNNVAPTIESMVVLDSAGNTLNEALPVTLVGLPVAVSATFTDPGVADTQVASLNWADGTVDSAFDLFTDASGGETGQLTHSHIYSSPGMHDVELVVTDDDLGAVSAMVPVAVVSAAEALSITANLLQDALDATPAGDVADHLQDAINSLIGNQEAQAGNGAVDALEEDDPVSAITHIIKALQAITGAEDAGGGDFSSIKDLLTLSAEALAVSSLADATAFVDPPSKGETKQLATIQSLIDAGHALVLVYTHIDACEKYRRAVAKALKLL
jgi:hypothetical protein